MPPLIRTFRLIVLGLAAFYFLERAVIQSYALSDFGWQFRYLTIWGLTGSLVVAGLMLTPTFGRPNGHGATLVSVVGVVNLLVVFSYWRLYFTDPALVNGSRQIVAYREYYLHLLGPVLQWADMLLIKRAFRVPWRTALLLGLLVLAYCLWAELVVAPLNDAPVGTVTTGLPYPFLNDMGLASRLSFYLSIYGTGLVFIVLLRLLQAGVERLAGPRVLQKRA